MYLLLKVLQKCWLLHTSLLISKGSIGYIHFLSLSVWQTLSFSKIWNYVPFNSKSSLNLPPPVEWVLPHLALYPTYRPTVAFTTLLCLFANLFYLLSLLVLNSMEEGIMPYLTLCTQLLPQYLARDRCSVSINWIKSEQRASKISKGIPDGHTYGQGDQKQII